MDIISREQAEDRYRQQQLELAAALEIIAGDLREDTIGPEWAESRMQ